MSLPDDATPISTILSPRSHAFHPTLSTSILPSLLRHSTVFGRCSPSLLYVLPPQLFIDRYALVNSEPKGSTPLVWGFHDLEAPLTASRSHEAGMALISLGERTTFDLTLHFRYLSPRAERTQKPVGDLVQVNVDPPHLVWRCGSPLPADVERFAPPGPASSLPPLYTLTSTTPRPSSTPIELSVPVGILQDLAYVEPITLLAVWGSAAWIAWKAWLARRRRYNLLRSPKAKAD